MCFMKPFKVIMELDSLDQACSVFIISPFVFNRKNKVMQVLNDIKDEYF